MHRGSWLVRVANDERWRSLSSHGHECYALQQLSERSSDADFTRLVTFQLEISMHFLHNNAFSAKQQSSRVRLCRLPFRGAVHWRTPIVTAPNDDAVSAVHRCSVDTQWDSQARRGGSERLELTTEWMTFAAPISCQASVPNWKHTFLLLRTRADVPSAAHVYWLLVNIMAL